MARVNVAGAKILPLLIEGQYIELAVWPKEFKKRPKIARVDDWGRMQAENTERTIKWLWRDHDG